MSGATARERRRGEARAAPEPRRPRAIAAALAALLAGVTVVAGPGEAAPIATLGTADFHALAFSAESPGVVFFGHHDGVMRSDDGGRTWRPLVTRPGFDAMSLAVSPAPPPRASRLYLAGHDVFQVSTDGGVSWRPLAHDLPGTDIHAFAVSPDDPDRLYAFVVGRGLYRSADGGRTWEPLAAGLPGDLTALAAAGGNPESLYAASVRGGVLRSLDGGRSWSRAASGLGQARVLSIAVDPTRRRTVYAGLAEGLYRSTDGGAAWTRLRYPGVNVAVLALSPVRPGVLLAISVLEGEGRVLRSEDGGDTWVGAP